ncbi:MAG: hypothetical protein AAB518_00885 [Patescibacteria group bacterium]
MNISAKFLALAIALVTLAGCVSTVGRCNFIATRSISSGQSIELYGRTVSIEDGASKERSTLIVKYCSTGYDHHAHLEVVIRENFPVRVNIAGLLLDDRITVLGSGKKVGIAGDRGRIIVRGSWNEIFTDGYGHFVMCASSAYHNRVILGDCRGIALQQRGDHDNVIVSK